MLWLGSFRQQLDAFWAFSSQGWIKPYSLRLSSCVNHVIPLVTGFALDVHACLVLGNPKLSTVLRCSLTSTEESGIVTSIDMLTIVLLIQPTLLSLGLQLASSEPTYTAIVKNPKCFSDTCWKEDSSENCLKRGSGCYFSRCLLVPWVLPLCCCFWYNVKKNSFFMELMRLVFIHYLLQTSWRYKEGLWIMVRTSWLCITGYYLIIFFWGRMNKQHCSRVYQW